MDCSSYTRIIVNILHKGITNSSNNNNNNNDDVRGTRYNFLNFQSYTTVKFVGTLVNPVI